MSNASRALRRRRAKMEKRIVANIELTVANRIGIGIVMQQLAEHLKEQQAAKQEKAAKGENVDPRQQTIDLATARHRRRVRKAIKTEEIDGHELLHMGQELLCISDEDVGAFAPKGLDGNARSFTVQEQRAHNRARLRCIDGIRCHSDTYEMPLDLLRWLRDQLNSVPPLDTNSDDHVDALDAVQDALAEAERESPVRDVSAAG